MTAEDNVRGERLEKDLSTKEFYHFVDNEKGINQKCREVFKHRDVEIHYPIGYDGGPKYKNASKFVYEGFDGRLPIGIQKSSNKGLGFTGVLKCFIDYIEEKLVVREITIKKTGKSSLDKKAKKLVLVENDLRVIYAVIKHLLDK